MATRAIEDVSAHYDWRPSAKRAVFFLDGKAFTSKDALNGFQALLEKVICGSKVSTTTNTEFCCCQEYGEQP